MQTSSVSVPERWREIPRPVSRWLGSALAIFLLATSAIAQPPETVSPGSHSSATVIERRCPTFSFESSPDAARWELEVVRLGGAARHDEREVVLRELIPGSVTTFTPSAEKCLEPGGRYAWSVRAHGADGVGDRSRLRLFEVSRAPSEAELAAALEVIRQHAASGSMAPVASMEPADEPRPTRRDGGSRDERASAALVAQAAASIAALQVDGGIAAGSFRGDGSGLTGLPTTATDLDCFGCVSGGDIATGSLTGSDVRDGTVSAADLRTGAVEGSELKRIRVVQVECSGDCSDITTVQACALLGSYEPFAVDCRNVDEDTYGSGSDFLFGKLSELCDDTTGGDANVYCILE